MEDFKNLISDAVSRLQQVASGNIPSCDVVTGFGELDRQMCGFDNGDFIVVGSRPGVGKTSFIISCALNNATAGVPVLFYSFDMPGLQITNRVISSFTGVANERLRKGQLNKRDWEVFTERIKDLYNYPMFVECDAPREIEKLCEHIAGQVRETNAKIIYIDYLQLLACSDKKNVDNRYQEVATFSRSLKALARQLNVPIVVTSQLNRKPEIRQEASSRHLRPNMYDLRDSGTICEDANLVLLLHRPEMYYRASEDEEGRDIRNLAEVIVAKHNNGPLSTVRLYFDKATCSFSDWDDSSGNSPGGIGGMMSEGVIEPF